MRVNKTENAGTPVQLPGSKEKELSMDVLKEASMHGVNLYEEYQRYNNRSTLENRSLEPQSLTPLPLRVA